jgi:hypothetical protein
MEKFDKAGWFQGLLDIFLELEKNSKDMITKQVSYLVRVPNFLEQIWLDGYKKGVEDGKKHKIDEISKMN